MSMYNRRVSSRPERVEVLQGPPERPQTSIDAESKRDSLLSASRLAAGVALYCYQYCYHAW